MPALTEVEVLAMFNRPDCPKRIMREEESYAFHFRWHPEHGDEEVCDAEAYAAYQRWAVEFLAHFETLVEDGELVEWNGHFVQPR